ncbi:TetR family transcriptional regulator [Rhodococcus sp. B50]|uniref:TetR family transcriptional regulator n=1 Tax=Rhodococcus sp. B50 TaxID=2682847 RepID=UPI001BD690DA|nr:TetR family transcriptional regulator [Rhodococcus sp. B50]MBS9372035.1 Tetracycline repressor protein class D [Rhodococcus sp. B50]
MARPSKPLISRAAAVTASIEIIDSEGLDAFSLPRLAKHLGVRAPSLYHHFSDKSEILAAVARQIAGAGTLPRRKPGPDWPEFFVKTSLNLRRSILKHRNAAPILLQYLPRDLLIGTYEDIAGFLEESGVPARLHVQILDGMERLTLGAVLTEAMRKPATKSTIFPNVDPASQPLLSKALAANEMTSQQLFEEMIRSFLHGVVRNENVATTEAAHTGKVKVSAD